MAASCRRNTEELILHTLIGVLSDLDSHSIVLFSFKTLSYMKTWIVTVTVPFALLLYETQNPSFS